MIIDVLGRIAKEVKTAVDEGYYRDFAAANEAESTPPSLEAAIRRDAPFAFLAEVKPTSPSAGRLAEDAGRTRQVLDIYRAYHVTGVSILTERDTFHGSLDLLAEAAALRRDAEPLPALMKDFIIDDTQLAAARAAGASAVLLIDNLLRRDDIPWDTTTAIERAHAHGLEVLLEVDDPQTFEAATRTEAEVIGINNRNLRTLELDNDRAIDIIRHRVHLVRDRPVLALSGMESRADILANQQAGLTGVLVGTSLMAARDVRGKLRAMRGVAHAKCCGTGHPDDDPSVRHALAGADAVGVLVGVPGAFRARTTEDARRVFTALPPDVERVIVTIAAPEEVRRIVDETGATHVQWHRDAAPGDLAALRDALDGSAKIIPVLRLPAAGAPGPAPVPDLILARARALLDHGDRLLLDTLPPDGGPAGGTGIRLDWAQAAGIVQALRPARIVLAGGLDPTNVRDALRQVRPWGVDLSSGIEDPRSKGRKDPARIRAFLKAVRHTKNLDEAPQEVDRLRVL
jgi:indole-3-glycerol phosphate synthase/phosphoribosylanthranilate isomerase